MDANTTDNLHAQGMESLDEAGSPPALAGEAGLLQAARGAVEALDSAGQRFCDMQDVQMYMQCLNAGNALASELEGLGAELSDARLLTDVIGTLESAALEYREQARHIDATCLGIAARALSSFSRPSPEPTEGRTRLPRGARSPSVPLVELQRELTRRISEARVAKDVATHCDNSASWSAATGKESVLMELHEWVTRTYSQAEPAESAASERQPTEDAR